MNKRERDGQLRKWIRAASEEEVQEWSGEVMWGVWFSPDSEDCPPPDALFSTKEDATAYASQRGRHEWDVSPCILGIVARNHHGVPPAA